MKNLLNDTNYKKYYANKELEAKLEANEYGSKNAYTNKELKVEIIEKGIVYPLEWKGGNIPYYGGVTDELGHFVELSSHKERKSCIYNEVNPKYKSSKKINFRNDEVIFIGVSFNHYMHTIIETMSRMWFYTDNLDKNIKLAYIKVGDEHPVFFEIMEILGIPKENLICISESPIQFKKVIVPEQSIVLENYFDKKNLDFIDKLKENIEPASYKKVYFSRGKAEYSFSKNIRKDYTPNLSLSEEAIEDVFRDNGFEIVYPTTLSLKEKISILKGAEVFAGFWGSNVSQTRFLNDGVRVLVLLRSDHGLAQNIQHKNFKITHIEAFHEILPTDSAFGPFILGNGQSNSLFNFFDDYGFKYDKNIFTVRSSDVAKYFLTWAENYIIHGVKELPKSIDTRELVDNIHALPIYDDINVFEGSNASGISYDDIYEHSILFGISKNKKYIKIYIFGIPIIFVRKKR